MSLTRGKPGDPDREPVVGVIRVVGLDTSQSSTGIARADIAGDIIVPGRGVVRGSWTGSVGIPPIARTSTVGEIRASLAVLAALVEERIGDPDLLVIESPAIYAGNAGALTLVGSWWLILDRILATRAPLPVLKIGPTKLKLYVAGNGRADKGDMVRAVRRHYGPAFDLPTDRTVTDVADAIGLVAIGARFSGLPIDSEHPDRARAMEGVGLRPVPAPPKRAGRTARRKTERTPDHP